MRKEESHRRFEFLDGLRGIAALLVVFFHFNNRLAESSIPLFPDFIDSFLNLGHLGVEIFFALSGFVIAYSIRNQTITFPFIGKFFIRRSIRLDPPYWIIVFILVALSAIGNLFKTAPYQLPGFTEITINLFYLSDFLETPKILPVSWTLAFEIQFYLFLVLLVKFLQFLDSKISQKQGSLLSFPSLAVLSFLMILSLLQSTPYSWFPNIPGLFLNKWYSFFSGTLACWTMLQVIKPLFFWINLGFIATYALAKDPSACVTCLISLVIYWAIMKDMMNTLLRGPIFQYLGKISYSLYLIHWVIGLKFMDIAVRFFGEHIESKALTFLLMMTALSFTLCASHIFYRFIELPSLRLSRKMQGSNRNNLKVGMGLR